ncbi:phosphoenolpyruvate synthase [Enterococcus sp. LJL128]
MSMLIDYQNYQEHQVGGKAARLFQLQKMGYRVPDLCCLSAELFQKSITEKTFEKIRRLTSSIDYESAASLHETSRKLQDIVREALSETAILDDLPKLISKRFPGESLFAVRSSGMIEDGTEDSFAGQFASFLSLAEQEIPESVVQCIVSQFQPNVLSYMRERAYQLEAMIFSVNVIIQVMVPGEYSGILFTANPQGLLNESVLVVGKGTGNLVVEDRVDTTSYYYQTTDQLYYYEQQAEGPLLEEAAVQELIMLGQELKKTMGQELDIEFTCSNQQFYLLQLRPITTLGKDFPIVLDNSNIVESYPGITLPLTFSFIKQAYFGVFRGLALRCVPDRRFVAAYENIFEEMLANVNGRVYYRLNNWYTLLSFLPMSRRIIPVWEEMLGITEEAPSQGLVAMPLHKRLRTYFQVVREAVKIPKGMAALNRSFIEIEELFQNRFHTKLTNQEIFVLYQEIKDQVLADWDITLLNDLYAFVYTGLLKRQLKKLNSENYEQQTNEFISGITDLESMKPVLALLHLAQKLVDSGQTEELFSIQTAEQAETGLKNPQTSMFLAVKEYIQLYGDRSPEELKLETGTFRAKPLKLFQELQSYAANPEILEKLLGKLTESEATAVRLLAEKKTSQRQQKKLERLSSKAMLGIKNREISRLNRSRLYGMVRSLFTVMGHNLSDTGLLKQPEDIFYLTIEELEEVNREEAPKINFLERIEKRKREYQQFKQLPAYTRLIYAKQEFNKYPQTINSVRIDDGTDDLRGIPCSEGIITAEVLVIENPHEVSNSEGKILVTKMTDPGWVFLLAKAAGVIAEKGSLLSHTAIISRELKIPSVVGVKNAVSQLKTGDLVTLNGNTGEILVGGKENVSAN